MLGDTDPTDCTPGPRDLDRSLHRRVEPDTLEDRIGAVAIGQVLDALDRLRAALADDIGCPELAPESDPIFVTTHDDDLLRT